MLLRLNLAVSRVLHGLSLAPLGQRSRLRDRQQALPRLLHQEPPVTLQPKAVKDQVRVRHLAEQMLVPMLNQNYKLYPRDRLSRQIPNG